MRTNATKAKLNEGGVVFGGIISEHAPGLVEQFGALGYDFVMLDCEHGAMDLNQIEHMVRAAEVFGTTPLVRVPNHEPSTLLRYLDRGAQGVIVPHVNTREQAAAVASAARYYPDGSRGAASGRAHDYNISASRAESSRWINDQTLVVAMIEETEAVANLDAILGVAGVDVLHVAASDLGQSMGNPPATEVRRVMRDVVGRINAAGKPAGIGGNSATDYEGVAELIRSGARFVTVQAWGLLRVGAELFRGRVAEALRRDGGADGWTA